MSKFGAWSRVVSHIVKRTIPAAEVSAPTFLKSQTFTLPQRTLATTVIPSASRMFFTDLSRQPVTKGSFVTKNRTTERQDPDVVLNEVIRAKVNEFFKSVGVAENEIGLSSSKPSMRNFSPRFLQVERKGNNGNHLFADVFLQKIDNESGQLQLVVTVKDEHGESIAQCFQTYQKERQGKAISFTQRELEGLHPLLTPFNFAGIRAYSLLKSKPPRNIPGLALDNPEFQSIPWRITENGELDPGLTKRHLIETARSVLDIPADTIATNSKIRFFRNMKENEACRIHVATEVDSRFTTEGRFSVEVHLVNNSNQVAAIVECAMQLSASQRLASNNAELELRLAIKSQQLSPLLSNLLEDGTICLLSKPCDNSSELTMYDPKSNNQLTPTLMIEIVAALKSANKRVAVITSGMGKFMSGDSLPWYHIDDAAASFKTTGEFYRSIRAIHDNVAVFVQGEAKHAGVELAVNAHHVVASPDAVFHSDRIFRGLMPNSLGSLIEKVGPVRAMFIACSGIRFNAQEAQQLGLVDQIVYTQTEYADHIAKISENPKQPSKYHCDIDFNIACIQLEAEVHSLFERQMFAIQEAKFLEPAERMNLRQYVTELRDVRVELIQGMWLLAGAHVDDHPAIEESIMRKRVSKEEKLNKSKMMGYFYDNPHQFPAEHAFLRDLDSRPGFTMKLPSLLAHVEDELEELGESFERMRMSK